MLSVPITTVIKRFCVSLSRNNFKVEILKLQTFLLLLILSPLEESGKSGRQSVVFITFGLLRLTIGNIK